jgi:hypothetical protein
VKKCPLITAALAWACTAAAPAYATDVPAAITLAANRLVSAQLATGDWPKDGGQFGVSYPGSITAGLADAYLLTGVAVYQASATQGANAILATAGGNFLGDEAWGLAMASQIQATPDNNPYHAALKTFYNVSVPYSIGGTQGYINTVASGDPTVALYYLAQHLAAAGYVHATDVAVWRTAVISTLARVNDSYYYPVLATSMATWALAQTGPLDNTLICSTGFWAGKHLADLPASIAGAQIGSGSLAGAFYGDFTDTMWPGFTEDAAYGIKALAAGGPYLTQTLAAKTWLANGVATFGIWQGMYTAQPAVMGPSYYVYTGKALQGLAAPFGATWNGGSGNWSDGTKWNVGQAPNNHAGANTYFDATIISGVVNVDTAASVRLLNVNGGTVTGVGSVTVAGGMISGNYSVSGTTTVTVATLAFACGTNYANLAGAGTASVSSGATLVLGPSTIASVVNHGQVVFNSGATVPVPPPAGGSTTLLGYAGTGSVMVQAGTLAIGVTSAMRGTAGVLLKLRTLTVAAGATLDVSNHDVMIGNASLATVEAEILRGFGKAGASGDAAITSSTAVSGGKTFLLPLDADALLGNGVAGSAIGRMADGVAITQPGTILVKYAYIGDVTLDGKIDALDMATAAGHVGQTSPGLANIQSAWLMGDVNFDGLVNGGDFALMQANMAASQASPLGTLNLAAVPEPGALTVAAAGLPVLLVRRRRKVIRGRTQMNADDLLEVKRRHKGKRGR